MAPKKRGRPDWEEGGRQKTKNVEEERGGQKIRERWAWKEKVSLTLTSTVYDANR